MKPSANYVHKSPIVQRLYSMFPVGGPGLGLLLLRFALIASTIYIHDPVIAILPHGVGFAALAVISVCLAVGLLTPIMAALAISCGCIALYEGTIPSFWCIAPPILNAVAMLLLGPGAYSVDRVLYGRRVLVTLPRRK